jgi:hypothetical protein
MRGVEALVRRTWPSDRATLDLVTRADTDLATTTGSDWAVLAQEGTVGLITSLGPTSAAAELFRRAGLSLVFSSTQVLVVPGIAAAAGSSGWISQGSPFPVYKVDTSGDSVVALCKLGTSFAFTRELLEHSAVEALVRAVVTERLALDLDKVLLGSSAATLTTPPGLLNGVAAQTPTTGTTVDAMRGDLSKLANVVAPVGGMNLAYIASPGEAVKIALAAGPQFKFPVIASGALTAGTVICVALNALATVVDPVPVIDLAPHATIHMSTSALELVSRTGPTTADPIRSAWQTDSIAIRFMMRVAWALRASNAISWVSNVTW